MRAYFWGNMYLSSIQQGIQAAHVVAEMMIAYDYHESKYDVLRDWAADYKTMILFNGGYQDNLIKIYETLHKSSYPHAMFREEYDSLNGAVTSVGIILPERVYELAGEAKKERSPASKLLCGYNDDVYIYTNSVMETVEAEVNSQDVTIADLIAKSKYAN